MSLTFFIEEFVCNAGLPVTIHQLPSHVDPLLIEVYRSLNVPRDSLLFVRKISKKRVGV